MTLTLVVGVQVLCMTYRLINITICAKYLQKPLNYVEVIDRTQNIPYNTLCQSLTSKCDLGGRDQCFAPDILSYYCDYLCKVFLKSQVMDWTQNIAYIRLCKSLTFMCDLHLGGRDTCVMHDISSYHCDYFCQVFSKSLDLRRSLKQTMLTFDL
jgi:hypothetical protein